MKKQLKTATVANELKGASLFFHRPATTTPTPVPAAEPLPSHQRVNPPTAPIAPVGMVPSVDPIARPPRSEGPARTPWSADRPEHAKRAERPGRSPRRFTRRHAFDIYDDQLATLRQLALTERMDGGVGSMSQMVRAAIDQFIAATETSQPAIVNPDRSERPGRTARDDPGVQE